MSSSKTGKRTVTSRATGSGAVSARDPEVPQVDGSQRAYDAFLSEAMKIPAEEARPFRYNGSLALLLDTATALAG